MDWSIIMINNLWTLASNGYSGDIFHLDETSGYTQRYMSTVEQYGESLMLTHYSHLETAISEAIINGLMSSRDVLTTLEELNKRGYL